MIKLGKFTLKTPTHISTHCSLFEKHFLLENIFFVFIQSTDPWLVDVSRILCIHLMFLTHFFFVHFPIVQLNESKKKLHPLYSTACGWARVQMDFKIAEWQNVFCQHEYYIKHYFTRNSQPNTMGSSLHVSCIHRIDGVEKWGGRLERNKWKSSV